VSVVQIAAHAGVSIATVSRVLNNSRRVNPRLVDQVNRAMQELNFTPSQIVRRPAARKVEEAGSTVAIISLGQQYRGWFEIPVIAAVVAEITRAANDHHMGTLLAEMPDPRELSPVIRRQNVQGAIVFIDSNLPAGAVSYLSHQVPVVRVMGGQFSRLEVDHVGADNNAVGYLAGQTLLDFGCRELAYLTLRPGWDFIKLRGQGFTSAVLAGGQRPQMFIEGDLPNADCIYGANFTSAPDGETLVEKVADAIRNRTHQDVPLGLFISRDEETVFIQSRLAAQGIRPDVDVKILSCDNEQVRLSALHPRPMSVDLNAAQIAAHAVSRLAERMKRPSDPPVRILVNPKLVLPASVSARAESAVSALA
jgi:DNA-binding LacI/PurR family transcriptional regulator